MYEQSDEEALATLDKIYPNLSDKELGQRGSFYQQNRAAFTQDAARIGDYA